MDRFLQLQMDRFHQLQMDRFHQLRMGRYSRWLQAGWAYRCPQAEW